MRDSFPLGVQVGIEQQGEKPQTEIAVVIDEREIERLRHQ